MLRRNFLNLLAGMILFVTVSSGCNGGEIQEITIPTGNLPEPHITESDATLLSGVVSDDGQIFVLGDNDSYVSIWDRESKSLLRKWQVIDQPKGTDGIENIAISPNGTHIALCLPRQSVQVWDIETEALVFEIPYKCRNVLQYSPDGDLIVAGSMADVIKIWDSTSGAEVLSIPVTVEDLGFNSTGSVLAYGEASHIIHLWDLENNQEIISFKGSGRFRELDFAPDDNTLATLSSNDTISIFNTENGELVNEFSPTTNLHLFDVAFSPKGEYLFVVHMDGVVQIWTSENPEQISSYEDEMSILVSDSSLATNGSALLISGITKQGLALLWEFGE